MQIARGPSVSEESDDDAGPDDDEEDEEGDEDDQVWVRKKDGRWERKK